MVAPVSVQHADFGNGRITLFGSKIILHPLHVSGIHGKSKFLAVFVELGTAHLDESVLHLDVSGHMGFHLKGLRDRIIS